MTPPRGPVEPNQAPYTSATAAAVDLTLIITPMCCTGLIWHLVSQPQQHAEEAAQVTLAGRQLASARVVRPVEGGGAVHDQQGIPGGGWEGLSVQQGNKQSGSLIIIIIIISRAPGPEQRLPLSLTWTRPSWRRPGTAAGSGGRC